VGTPEPNKRVVPLDVFPSGVLDNLVVQKSYTPDQDGEFGGGVVNLNTKDFVDGKRFSQSVTTGVSARGVSRSFLTYSGGKLDFLGFDDGTRALPGLLTRIAGGQRVAPAAFDQPGLTPGEVQSIGRSFANVWSPRGEAVRPNYAYSGAYSAGFTALGREVGLLTSLSWSNSFTSLDRENNAYVGSNQDLTPLYQYRVEESSAKVLGGALSNLSVRLADQQMMRLRVLYTRSAEDNARISDGPNYDFGSSVRVTHIGYVERGLLSGVLSGEHALRGLGNLLLDWNAGYSIATRDEPDRREFVYELVDAETGEYQVSRRVLPLTRIFGEMREHDRSQRLNVTLPFSTWAGSGAKAKAGYAHRNRDRASSFRRFGFLPQTQAIRNLDLSLPPESLLVDENIKPGWFSFIETTRENDRYRAGQGLNAAYAMVDAPVLPRLRLVGGARWERSEIAVESQSPFAVGAQATFTAVEDKDLLPSLNLTYAITPGMNLRAGYSETVSRPEFRELSPFGMFDYETGYTEYGNADLGSSRILNYDLRVEQYLDARELVAVSVFHKSLDRPIESVVQPSSGDYVLSPRNGREGRLTGAEVETRLGLARMWDAVGAVLPAGAAPSALGHFALSGNWSRVSTRVQVKVATASDGSDIERVGPLNGQASYAMNLGLFYGSGAFEGALLYTAFGRRLSQVGAGQHPNNLPDVYEHPLHSLDLTLARSIGTGLRVKLSAENLLDDVVEFRQGDQVARRHVPGRAYSLSLQWR
jgi:outer membrane receptor protein involved in Fe transport